MKEIELNNKYLKITKPNGYSYPYNFFNIMKIKNTEKFSLALLSYELSSYLYLSLKTRSSKSHI